MAPQGPIYVYSMVKKERIPFFQLRISVSGTLSQNFPKLSKMPFENSFQKSPVFLSTVGQKRDRQIRREKKTLYMIRARIHNKRQKFSRAHNLMKRRTLNEVCRIWYDACFTIAGRAASEEGSAHRLVDALPLMRTTAVAASEAGSAHRCADRCALMR